MATSQDPRVGCAEQLGQHRARGGDGRIVCLVRQVVAAELADDMPVPVP
ncbi:MAG: hypothetical protein ACLQNE_15210 [Thermoguttaceae bacterium]